LESTIADAVAACAVDLGGFSANQGRKSNGNEAERPSDIFSDGLIKKNYNGILCPCLSFG
jgi:hypothetical protein